jgi:hypothetical protein
MSSDPFTDLFGARRSSGLSRDTAGVVAATLSLEERPCIEHIFAGGSELVPYSEFVAYLVQDEDVARRVAKAMLTSTDPYRCPWNQKEPEYAASFRVADAEALRAQLAVL